MKRFCAAVALSVTAALAIGVPAHATTTTPSPASIKANLKAAEASHSTWATFNICGPSSARTTVGIRGQMPALAFATRMRMVVTLSAYSANLHRYARIPGHWTESVGIHSGHTLVQQGVRLRFTQPVTLVAHITFQWYLNGKLLGQTTRASAGGLKKVGDSTPKGYSVSTCSVS